MKREDVHELGAFKWRGSLPVVQGHAAAGAPAVVTASTGNHGAATAWAAAQVGVRAVVFAPEGATRAKVALIEALGAEVRLVGDDLDEAKELGTAWALAHGLPFFEDGAEPAQYDAYGAIADEILEQAAVEPAAVVVPVGNGALLGGVGGRLAARGARSRRVGVVAKEAPVMADSWDAGHVVESSRSETFADGMAVRVAIPYAVGALAAAADEMVRVTEREIAYGVAAFAEAGLRVEGAAGAALAALTHVEADPVVLVVTGRNIDDELYRRAVEAPESFPA